MVETITYPLKLSVVIPVYNGEASIGRLLCVLDREVATKVKDLEVVVVNDGSPDQSKGVIAYAQPDLRNLRLKYVELITNFGEHNAVMCGLNYSTGEYVAIIDDDFQNPPTEIFHLLDRILRDKNDVVYSFYEQKRHHWFRNMGSKFNDWIATLLLNKPKNLYLSSFKIMNRVLVDAVTRYDGPFPYIDGIIFSATKNIGSQLVQHDKRAEGASNYTIKKLVRLWMNMFTGYSIAPLRVASFIGLVMSFLTPLMIFFYVFSYLNGGVFVHKVIPPGWASIIILVNFFGGIQLLVLGLAGEYIGRLFLTVNKKPQYLVRTCELTDQHE